jgi:hypothetical protein
MFNPNQSRGRQEQLLARESRAHAKVQLEKALALAETKEREYREALEDVRRKVDELELASSRAKDPGEEIPAEHRFNAAENQPMLMRPANSTAEMEATEGQVTPVPVQSAAPDSPVVNSPRRSTQVSSRWSMKVQSTEGAGEEHTNSIEE